MNTRVPVEAVAEHFGVAVVTVRSWVTKGILPPDLYLKFGGRYVFDLEGVEAFWRQKTDEDYAARMAKLKKPVFATKKKEPAPEPTPEPEPEPEPVVEEIQEAIEEAIEADEPVDDLSWIDDFDDDL